jgi:hypothetical protein
MTSGLELGAWSEGVGERMIMLSVDSELLIACEGHFFKCRTCNESVASSVSVGGGDDGGKLGQGSKEDDSDESLGGKEIDEAAAEVAVTEAMALQCDVSSNSPALSAVSFAVGKIFRVGQKDIVKSVER